METVKEKIKNQKVISGDIGNISLHDNEVFDTNIILENVTGGTLKILNGHFENLDIINSEADIIIKGGHFKKLFVDIPGNKLVIEGGTFDEIEVKKGVKSIKNIQSNDICFWGANVLCPVQHSQINGFIVLDNDSPELDHTCTLKNLIIDHFYLNKLIANYTFELNDVSVNESIVLMEVESSKFFLNHCDFSKCKLIYSVNTDFKRLKYSYVKWGKKLKIVDYSGKEDINSYRQLKTASMRHDDKIGEQFFKSKEMSAHFEQLKLFSSYWIEWIILFLNKVSNGFGVNWWRSLLCVIVFSIIMYPVYVYSSSLFEFTGYKLYASEVIAKYFEFLLPTHSVDFLSELHPKNKNLNTIVSSFIDFFHRIFNSFFIYQFIAAFRRFGMK